MGDIQPPKNELVLARRMRVLRGILLDPDSPYRARLIDITDLLIETEDGPTLEVVADDGVARPPVHMLGAAPPRRGRLS